MHYLQTARAQIYSGINRIVGNNIDFNVVCFIETVFAFDALHVYRSVNTNNKAWD